MSKNDYKEFLAQFGFWMNHIKKWLNTDMLTNGVLFPYGVDEFKSKVYFKEKSMHITLEVESEAAEYFEDKYWDKNDHNDDNFIGKSVFEMINKA